MSDQNRSAAEIEHLFDTVNEIVLGNDEPKEPDATMAKLSELLPLGTTFRYNGCTREEALRLTRLYIGEAETAPTNTMEVLEDLEEILDEAALILSAEVHRSAA